MESPRTQFHEVDVEELKSRKENQFFEKKPPKIQGVVLGERISGMANVNPEGGLIAIGLNDDNETITGISCVGEDKINRLIKALNDYVPDAHLETKIVPCKNDRGEDDAILLILVNYSPDKVIKDVRGKAFKRMGESTIEMNADEIRQLQIDKKETDFELAIVEGATLDDLDHDLLKNFVERWVMRDRLETKPVFEDALITKGYAVRADGKIKITNAGVLLFGKMPQRWFPGAKIRFIKYEGTTAKTGASLNMTKDKTVEGSLVKQFIEATRTVQEHVRELSKLDKDGRFTSIPEYPEFAWVEAIVNGLVHRSYFLKNKNIFIRFFDDHLEVESPGSFPGIVTPENIYTQHFPRNPRLMEGFRTFEIVKAASEGANRMRQLMREHNLPDPVFEDKKGDYQVVVKLFNDISRRKVVHQEAVLHEKIKKSLMDTLTPDEKKIVLNILQNGKIQTGQAVEVIGRKSRERTIEILRALMGKGIVARKGESGPNVYYEIDSGAVVHNDTDKSSRKGRGVQGTIF